jgi:hypothetical protein
VNTLSTPTPGQAPRSDPDAAYAAWTKAPTPDSLRAVVDAHDSTISSALKAYAPQHADNAVVRQRARLMAADAIRTYRGGDAKLATHIHSQLQTLRRVAPRVNDPFPKPERLAIDTAKIESNRVALADKLGREPSIDELAEFGKYDVSKLKRAMSRNRAVVPESSIDGQGDDEDNAEVMPGVRKKSVEAVWADYVFHDLSDTDKVVFQHRTGYGGAPILPNEVIARRLRISPAAVTQRATRVQAKLNQLHGVSTMPAVR